MSGMPLEQQIQTALFRNPHLSGRTLRFETSDGHVVLRGAVASFYQKQMAQETLRKVAGVASIQNQLEVNWS